MKKKIWKRCQFFSQCFVSQNPDEIHPYTQIYYLNSLNLGYIYETIFFQTTLYVTANVWKLQYNIIGLQLFNF